MPRGGGKVCRLCRTGTDCSALRAGFVLADNPCVLPTSLWVRLRGQRYGTLLGFHYSNVVTTTYMDYAEIMRILLLFVTLFFLTSISAGVYRSVDEDGNVIFTDRPSPDAEKIRVDKVQTISPPAVKDFEYTSPEKPAKEGYAKLEIISPQNDQTFTGGAGNVTINILIEPALDTKQGDHLVLTMDGEKQAESSSTSFSFTNLDRGTHTTKADIVNKGGKSLKSSATVTFYVIRPTVSN